MLLRISAFPGSYLHPIALLLPIMVFPGLCHQPDTAYSDRYICSFLLVPSDRFHDIALKCATAASFLVFSYWLSVSLPSNAV